MKKLLLVGLLGSSVLGLSAGKVEPTLIESRVWKGIKGAGFACAGACVGSIPIAGTQFIKSSNSARVSSNPSGLENLQASGVYAAGFVPGALVVGPVLYNAIFRGLGQHVCKVPDSELFQKGSSLTARAKRVIRGSRLATALLFVPTYIALADRARIEYETSRSK